MFVGDSDGPELERMGRKLKQRGHIVGSWTGDIYNPLKDRLREVGKNNARVKILGGVLFDCVAKTAFLTVWQGIPTTVDLPNCRISERDHGYGRRIQILSKRQSELRLGMGNAMFSSPLLYLTGESIKKRDSRISVRPHLLTQALSFDRYLKIRFELAFEQIV